MLKTLLALMIGLCSAQSYADSHYNLAFGHGTDQGGALGFKYSINEGRSRFYASLGLLTYSDRTGINPGYGIGSEYALGDLQKHALGIFLGTISGATLLDEKTTYDGAALTYNYYFKGFRTSSFVLGADFGYGKSSNEYTRFNEDKLLLSIKASYEW